jgi:hypothetical protein
MNIEKNPLFVYLKQELEPLQFKVYASDSNKKVMIQDNLNDGRYMVIYQLFQNEKPVAFTGDLLTKHIEAATKRIVGNFSNPTVNFSNPTVLPTWLERINVIKNCIRKYKISLV